MFHRFTRLSKGEQSYLYGVKKVKKTKNLKWYYHQKITFIFSSNFETLFTKHSPSEILSLNFDKKTVYLTCNFPI